MVLTLDNAGALVPGVKIKEESVETKMVKVLRGFFDGKNSLKPGEIVALPIGLAMQAKDARKVEFMPEESKPPKVESLKIQEKIIAPEVKSEKPEEVKPELKDKPKK